MTKNYCRVNLHVSIRSARIAFLLLILTLISLQGLANSRSVNLAEMISHAGRVVHGRVVEVREGVHPLHEQVAVTFLKVQVIEMLVERMDAFAHFHHSPVYDASGVRSHFGQIHTA